MSVEHPCMDHARNTMLLELSEPKLKVKLSKKLLKMINAPVKRAEKERKQRIFKSTRASPAETRAAVIEIRKSGQHEVKIIADDLNFINWDHPFTQYAIQIAFPVPANMPGQLERVRDTVGINVFIAYLLGVMEKLKDGKLVPYER